MTILPAVLTVSKFCVPELLPPFLLLAPKSCFFPLVIDSSVYGFGRWEYVQGKLMPLFVWWPFLDPTWIRSSDSTGCSCLERQFYRDVLVQVTCRNSAGTESTRDSKYILPEEQSSSLYGSRDLMLGQWQLDWLSILRISPWNMQKLFVTLNNISVPVDTGFFFIQIILH